MYSILEVLSGKIVPQKKQDTLVFNSLRRVNFPVSGVGSGAVHNPSAGYEFPPQYEGEDNDPIAFRLYEVSVVDTGAGPIVVSTSAPVYDSQADTVTVTRTLKAASAPNPANDAESYMTNHPFIRAWVKRQAQKEGKTPRQIMDEIRNNV